MNLHLQPPKFNPPDDLDATCDPDATTPKSFNPKDHPRFNIEPPRPWQHISSPLARVIDRLRVVDDAEDQAA